MTAWLLDTSALLALRDNEAGADQVEELLKAAANGEQSCHGCFMSLMEIYYRVWKDEGKAAGYQAYQRCMALPITWLHETPELLERAASLKATQPLSLADAWIAAAAQLLQATLVHKDPEFENLPGLVELRLPYKTGVETGGKSGKARSKSSSPRSTSSNPRSTSGNPRNTKSPRKKAR